ncbi:MAG TPA: two-component regulator propeller domain-containing protein [Sphingobacteriaceae bacterium]|nr:two-component regulator propeller domain-containing protein [Sphingobacteriaceae bacterium]
MKYFIRIFCVPVLFSLLTGVSFGQQILFRNYSVNDGLCSNTVWNMAQDDQGYMWFGTKDGLNRYDGYNFKSFRYNKSVPSSLGSNFIHRILNVDKTHLWIATDQGVYILDLQKETFVQFKPIGNKVIFDLVKDKKGCIWISTKDHGIYRYDLRQESLKNYSSRPGDPNSLSSNNVRRIVVDDYGNIWAGTFGGGIDVLNPITEKLHHYRSGKEPGSLSSNYILELYKDLKGNIWVGTLSGGLNFCAKGTGLFKTYVKSGSNSINDNIVRSIHQPSDGKLYIGTEKGLNVFYINENKFISYTAKNNDPFSISDNAVYSIFQDREGGIWTGTYFGGVNYFHEKGSNFELYYPTGDPNSLSGNAVSAFLQDKPGFFWVGTEDGGLNYFNSTTKTFRHYPFVPQQQKLSYHNIHALFKDKSGNIWIGTFTGGLNIYNPATGEVKNYRHSPGDENSLSNNTIYSIYEDKKGIIWIGTVSGLNRYDPLKDNFERVKNLSLDRDCIYAMSEDDYGNIWFATYDSGLIGREKSGRWISFSHLSKGNSISSNKVVSMLDDHSGNLWLGTDGGGLNLFNIKTRSFKNIGSKEGINSAVIYGILKDNSAGLWLSTNNGLYQYNPRYQKSIHYTQWDNLQSKQFNYNAAYKSPDGKFYFGGINGFNSFYPDSIKALNHPQKVVITNFQLFNKDVKINGEDSPLDKIIGFSDEITLAHSQSVISLEYAALSYISPQKTQYAFKMEGFDKNWNYVGEQRKATYTNLPAGNYVFKIKSTNSSGKWSNYETKLKVIVQPPFYRTNLAYLLYLIAGAAAVISIRKYVLREQMKKNEIRVERLKNIEEQEFYKQKIDFFTTMAHEIRTPLSLIAAPLERLMNFSNLDHEVNEQLQTMGENSERLQTLVTQLLDFRRIESDIYEIHTEKIEIVSLVQSLFTRFYPVAYQKGLKFSVETKISHLDVNADPEALTKILSNLLINAFKFTRTRVKIKILEPAKNDLGQNVFSVSVEDDGIGIPKEQVDNIFKKFFKVSSGQYDYSNLGGTGIGLALAKSLSEKHNGKLLVESQEGKKTVFTVQIPFLDEIDVQELDLVQAPDADDDEKQLILVVEDDRSMINFIMKSLQADGYKTIGAGNGTQALKILEDHHIDLIISDVMMPGTDGMELCKKVKDDVNFSHIPFVLLTAKANSEAEIQGFENGADAYIVKPFKWKHVSVVIKNLLGSRIKLKDKFTQQPLSEADTLTTNTRDSKFIQKIIKVIEERITDPQLSVEELSREMAMSRSSLHKKVKSMTGSVPNEFIRLIRLKHAAKLLALDEYNVSEIGYLAGFNSHSYFSKCFYNQFNQTPSEFAENKRVHRTA